MELDKLVIFTDIITFIYVSIDLFMFEMLWVKLLYKIM